MGTSLGLAPCEDAVIATPSGTVRVRPYVSAGKEIKAMLHFTPRYASFNRENTKSQRDEFRGFFTLFWIGEWAEGCGPTISDWR